MQSSRKTPLILWALMACLIVINFVTMALLIRQRVEVMRLQSEIVTLRGELAARAETPSRPRWETPGVYVGLRTDNHAVRLEKIEQ